MKKRILISAGGTGGHLYPAMAIAESLSKDFEILFAGGKLSSSPVFDSKAFVYKDVSCGTLKPNKLLAIAKGVIQSYKVIRDFKPDLVLGFGSYHTFPVLLASCLQKTPILLHEANCMPGKVNRLISRFAIATGVYFPDAQKWLKGKAIPVEMPLRKGYVRGEVLQSKAREQFSLKPELPTLLIFGGSQGAQAINRYVCAAMKKIQSTSHFQVLHFTGNSQMTEKMIHLYQEKGILACVKDFEPRMDLAWQASDFVISRAGAGTVAEQIEFEVPGLLIPYPYAADQHQHYNAEFMVKQVGGTVSVLEEDLNEDVLIEQIERCLQDEQARLRSMSDAIRHYKKTRNMTPLHTMIKQCLNGEG